MATPIATALPAPMPGLVRSIWMIALIADRLDRNRMRLRLHQHRVVADADERGSKSTAIVQPHVELRADAHALQFFQISDDV